MKVEIDLKEILFDEDYGPETLQESIKRQVIEKVSKITIESISRSIDKEISKMINEEIKKAVENKMESLILQALDSEYCQIDRWGDRVTGVTTFRKELIKKVQEEMQFKPENASYNRDKENTFTKAVRDVASFAVKEFQESFKKTVTEEFKKDAISFALGEIKNKLNLK